MSGAHAVAEERVERAAAKLFAVSPLLFALVTLGVLLLGALEDWFGADSTRDLYGSDAVQYLDVARAVGRGDWHTALNPLWSLEYPRLIAMMRPLFHAGPWGDWLATRALNLVIFALCWAAFCFLVRELLRTRFAATLAGPARWLALGGAVGLFLTMQLTIGQASRTGPDELVATVFLLASALLLKLMRPEPVVGLAVLFGAVLGYGFLVKAAFLALGAVFLLAAAVAIALRSRRVRTVLPLMAALVVFAAIVLAYGTQLSGAVGHPTLGESGALNYAWHVDRLAKWVHWEGGDDPADKAWPKPALARFAHWETDPPDFGRPIHPSVVVGSSPRIFVFHAPVTATYVPYFDPPYWYEGYRHVFRWRFQAIALAKGVGDLAEVLDRQPMVYACTLVLLVLSGGRRTRRDALSRLRSVWPVLVCAAFAVAIFVPVHLEGRYFSGALLVLATTVLLAVCAALERPLRTWQIAVCAGLLLVGTVAGLVRARQDVIARVRHGWSPAAEPDWVMGEAVAAAGLPAGSQVGMISWQPNLASDWAYVAQVQITSEIADGADEKAFWALPAEAQTAVLGRFRQAGAQAVLTEDRPPVMMPGWRQLPGTAMWMYRF